MNYHGMIVMFHKGTTREPNRPWQLARGLALVIRKEKLWNQWRNQYAF